MRQSDLMTGRRSLPDRNRGSEKMAKNTMRYDLPTTQELEAELKRVNDKSTFRVTLRSTIYTLITVSAIAVLVAVLLLPVLRIYGTSMTPLLKERSEEHTSELQSR